MWKSTFNSNLIKYSHANSAYFVCGILTLFSLYCYNLDFEDTALTRSNYSSVKYLWLSKNPKYGRFDNVLNKFENENGGLYDQ